MTALGRIRAGVLQVALAAVMCMAAAAAQAQGRMQLTEADAIQNRPIYLGVDKSMVIDLPRPAGDVLVSNPAIADAVLRTSRRLYLIGVKLGQASVFLFDQTGAEMASFDVYVEQDLTALNQILAEAIPDGYVRADAMNGNVVLRGQVASASASSRAEQIVVGLLDNFSGGTETEGGATGGEGAGGGAGEEDNTKNLVNLITITGEEQVALKVTVAEVERTVSKQIGINLAGQFTDPDGGLSFGTQSPPGGLSPITLDGALGVIGARFTGVNGFLDATLAALEETDMVRTLAEPTLTAVSGETANFHAGGEFPIQVIDNDGDDDTIRVTFKKFGVQLAFTPVVLSAGRISLRVGTSVSEISGFASGFPILDTREAETTVELPSGGSFAIAGLIQENTLRDATGFPGLQKLPILGALFSSKRFTDRETELVIFITPYLVKPTSPKDLARPDENMVMADDTEAFFLHRLTEVYGKASPAPGGAATGQVGFSFD